MNTVTATSARINLFNILKKTVRGHLHTRITSREGNVVLLSEDDYENILETAELLDIPGLKESIQKADRDIKKGKTFSFDEVFK